MNAKQRFKETMHYGQPDRVPYFEEGIRRDVLKSWYQQGLSPKTKLSALFPCDRFEELNPELDPIPAYKKWPTTLNELNDFKKRLNPDQANRFPKNLKRNALVARANEALLFFRVHRGFFLTMGVYGWQRFEQLMVLLVENPDFVKQSMMIQGEFAARLLDKMLKNIQIDAAVFSEAMDYRALRKEYGRDLLLIGGIDLDVLREDKEAIRKEVQEKVPPLIADGGYVPLADGWVRKDISFEKYFYYRRLLDDAINACSKKGRS